MKRLTAAIWILGATLPLLVVTVLSFGCCVLPFHGVLHRLMPVCHTTAAWLSASQSSEDEAKMPAPPRREPARRVAMRMPSRMTLHVMQAANAALPVRQRTSLRNLASLGATRCDRDVGLHVLVATFRI